MGVVVSNSVAMSDLMNFNSYLIEVAKKLDLDGAVLINIGDQCMCYSNGNHRVEIANHHVDLDVSFYKDDDVGMRIVYTRMHKDELVNKVLNWLIKKVIFDTPLPVKNTKVASPIDGKYFDTVDVVVQISSSQEVSSLYQEFKDKGWSYKQDMGGYSYTIGHIGDRPVCITPLIHVIDGVRVLYVEVTSELIDWAMINVWVKDRVKDGTPTVMDPTNLMSAIIAVKHNRNTTIGANSDA